MAADQQKKKKKKKESQVSLVLENPFLTNTLVKEKMNKGQRNMVG